LLLLHSHLWRGVLAGSKASHPLAAHLRSLEGLEMSYLQRIETWGTKHLLRDEDLALGKLHQLRLALVLEIAKRTDRLVDRATGAVTGLEWRGIGTLVQIEVAHVLSLVVLRRLLLVVRLPPVAFEVAR
jgi:hypothetical protein